MGRGELFCAPDLFLGNPSTFEEFGVDWPSPVLFEDFLMYIHTPTRTQRLLIALFNMVGLKDVKLFSKKNC